jgi:transposase-like protein
MRHSFTRRCVLRSRRTLEAELTETLCAEKGERTEARLHYRSGYYQRSLVTRVGTLELRGATGPRRGFSTELLERYEQSEKALVGKGRRQVLAVELANRESRSSRSKVRVSVAL